VIKVPNVSGASLPSSFPRAAVPGDLQVIVRFGRTKEVSSDDTDTAPGW
jgi:hypothetical protein